MKTLKNFPQLLLIWIISIVSLCTAIAVYQCNSSATVGEFFYIVFIFMIYSFFCSFPAFIFFSMLSMLVLQQNWSPLKKRGYILCINFIDIAGTAVVLFGFTFREFNHAAHNLLQFYPCWVLLLSSSLAICFMPFKHRTTTHPKGLNNPL
jgi:hypothetical protein